MPCDPLGIADIRELINRIAAEGKTIILASHLLDEVQKVCTDFAVLYKGNLIHTGNVNDELNDATYFAISADDITQLADVLKAAPFTTKLTIEEDVAVIESKATGAEINKYLIDRNIIASQIAPRKKTLENQFLNLVAQHEKTA